MARKNTLQHKLSSGQSMASSFATNPTIIKYLDNCSYQINITTTDSVGNFFVQGSNDYAVSEVTNTETDPGNWVDLVLSGAPFSNAANDNILIELNQLPFNAIRVRYSSTVAGTGTCDIYLTAKQVGG